MKEILRKIVYNLKDVEDMTRDRTLAILNVIDTEENANRIPEYLEENKNDKEKMTLDNVLEQTWKILGAI